MDMTKMEYEYKVISKIDNKEIHSKIKKILSQLEIGKIISTKLIFNEHKSSFGNINNETVKNIISKAFKIARESKMIERIDDKSAPDWFRNLDTVSFFQAQLRGNKFKNSKSKNTNTTKTQYLHQLWKFNKWLTEDIISDDKTMKKRTFTITGFQTKGDSFVQKIEKKSFENVEELLRILDQPFADQKNVTRIIKQYLLDQIHSEKKASYMNMIKSEIVSYFEKNEHLLHLSYDPKTTHNTETEEQEMSLAEFMEFLTVGKPSLTEKTLFLCKFHRGLDASTLVDRFNYEAWEQIVKWFGSEDHNSWDLTKCPVPISLVRIKNDFKHIGFLDNDAIEMLQKYLDYRKEKTKSNMQKDSPLFLNKFGRPITPIWIYGSFSRIAKRSGIQKLIGGNAKKQFKVDSHELRDLLKSTLIDSECRIDVADHVIGHKPKDSYEKQGKLYPETLRKEYSKASKRLNLFSKFSNIVSGKDNPDTLITELNEKNLEMGKMIKKQKEQTITRYQEEFFAKRQQDQMEKVLQDMADMKSELENMKSLKKDKSEKIEFCCIDCKLVHDKESCPACGSKHRRLYEEPIKN